MNSQKGFIKMFISWTVIIALISGVVAVVFNLPNSLPGELIYPLKEISENLQVASNELNYGGRARTYIKLSDNRLSEFRGLVNQRKKTDQISITLRSLTLMQNKALKNIQEVRSRGDSAIELAVSLESSLKEQEKVLRELQHDITREDYEVLLETISVTQQNLEKIGVFLIKLKKFIV